MTTIRSLIDSRAAQTPADVFLVAAETGAEVSWADLQAAADEVEHRLTALGIAPGEKVAFLMENGRATALLFLAIMSSGRVVVPLNAVTGDDQLRYVVEHADTALLIASPAYLARARQLLVDLDPAPAVVECDEDGWPQWPASAGASAAPTPPPQAHTDALLIYTSGTTGRPKGVVHTHRSVIAGGHNTVEAHHLTAADRGLCVLPLYHINAEIVTVVAPLVSGGSVVMPRRFSASAFWELMARHRCSWFSVVPTIIAYLLDRAEIDSERVRSDPALQSIRFGRSASSALAPSTHRAFEAAFGIPIVETMGLSETAAQILSNPMPPFEGKYGSPGIPYGNEVRIMDEQGRLLGPDEPGELVVRGDNVMRAYYKNPEASAETITAEGWLRTGDLGYQDAEGFFFVTGRLKELIIKGGENIAPREIDEVLVRHPAVLEAAAFAVADERYGQEVMACVVPRERGHCDGAELHAFCIEHLGTFRAPREVHVVEWLPKGPSGKVQRLKVAAMLETLREKPEEAVCSSR